MKKENYKAQALAIAMVVLVVSSILAISVYSRISKDKELSLDERSSAEALEVSDLVLNYLTAVPIKDVVGAIPGGYAALNSTEGITLTQNQSNNKYEIGTLLTALSLTADLNALTICPVAQGDNTYFLNIRKADLNTPFEVRPGQMMALPIKGIPLGSGCENTKISAVVRGDSGAGFSLTNIYATYSGGVVTAYKPYEEADVINYCFATSTKCNNANFLEKETVPYPWTVFKDDNSQTLTVNLNSSKTYNAVSYRLDEIRITAIGGTVGIAYQIPSTCTEDLNMLNVQVGANCGGTYRGKSVLIPQKQWGSPIFNYVIFNGEGSL